MGFCCPLPHDVNLVSVAGRALVYVAILIWGMKFIFSSIEILLLSSNILNNLDGLISARNLFDADYREPSTIGSGIEDDYPMAGIYLFAELRYRF